MNALALQNVFVSLSHPLRSGTVGQCPKIGTDHGTSHRTASLKSLADKVLRRSRLGQAVGQHVGQNNNNCPRPPSFVGQKYRAAPAPGSSVFSTGLEWLPGPPDSDASSFDTWWSAFDLHDLCHLYSVRIVAAGKRVVAIFPASLEPELVAYTSALLDDTRLFLLDHIGKLPVLGPTETVTIIMAIMREHPGLHFCRGDDGSRWPLYPKEWTAGQKATVQSLWTAAGNALDQYDFTVETSGER
jgi:hypothetical protein